MTSTDIGLLMNSALMYCLLINCYYYHYYYYYQCTD